MNGPDFYDNAEVFGAYQATREGADDLNALIEAPAVRAFTGDVSGLDVLELGCGDARYGKELLLNGARSYTGLDGSERMASRARDELREFQRGAVTHRRLEEWRSAPGQYDLVVSRMTLHYLEDLKSVLKEVYKTLRPEGRLVVSVEHPVVTCHYRDNPQGGIPSSWIVTEYFVDGPRTCEWLGSEVTKFHRTIQQWLTDLRRAGFTLLDLDEGEIGLRNVQGESRAGAEEPRRLVPMYLTLLAEAASAERSCGVEPRLQRSERID